jgi:bifunctional DNA-binding transcriptional regulator/antitoxin component of YhaV-PrlF toxin-antitoxin module
MSLDYDKVWNSMNELDDTTTNYVQIRELLQSYNKDNDKFIDCIITLLDHYINVQDQAFKSAWKETVGSMSSTQHSSSPQNTSGDNKWILLVEVDTASDDYFVSLPDDLLERVGWKDGDTLVWEDNKNGTWSLKKDKTPVLDEMDELIDKAEKFYDRASHKLLTYQEAVDAGYSMTGDGFWIPPQKNEDFYVHSEVK